MIRRKLIPAILPILIAGLTIGCESHDDRLAEFAQQATKQQAHQNEEIARQSQQVTQQSGELAEAAHQLVEQDAASRRELIEAQVQLHAQIHEERQRLEDRQQELRAEEKTLASARIREPIVAQAIFVGGIIIAALLPLIVTAYALSRLPTNTESDDELLTEVILHEWAGPRPAVDNEDGQLPALPEANRQRLAGRGLAPAPADEPPSV